MAEWQPVETAPKDGTRILVFTKRGDYELSYWFKTEMDEFEPIANTDLYWKRMKTYYEGWNSNGFTHWMPLPDPPESK